MISIKRLIVLPLVFFILLLSACSNGREINDLPTVVGIALDSAEHGDIRLTLQLIKTNASDSEGESGGDKHMFINIKKTGKDIVSILSAFSAELGGRLYLSHNLILIFGREVAENGISDYIDSFTRFQEIRPDTLIFVADDEADEILEIEQDFESITALYIKKLAETGANGYIAVHETLLSCAATAKPPQNVFAVPLVKKTKSADEEMVSVIGTALFSDFIMTGELSRQESRGLSWALGNAGKTSLTVCSGSVETDILVNSNTSNMKVMLSKGNVIVNITIHVEYFIGGRHPAKDFPEEDFSDNDIKKAVEKQVQDEIRASYKKCNLLKTDGFGVLEKLYRYDRTGYELIKDHSEAALQNSRLNISADCVSVGNSRIN